ncbi:Transposase IS605 OrfB [Geitlerinema sp. FC II]|nr:Transposase IS605 OrfB [Geitlerinema sp. FC II]
MRQKIFRAEGIGMLTVSGTGTAADGGNVRRSLRSSRSLHPRERRPKRGRKSVLRQSP